MAAPAVTRHHRDQHGQAEEGHAHQQCAQHESGIVKERLGAELVDEHHAHGGKTGQHGQRKRQRQAQVLAQQQFAARDGVGQQQVQRAALALAHDGIESQQQRDQRHQVDDETDQAGDGEFQ